MSKEERGSHQDHYSSEKHGQREKDKWLLGQNRNQNGSGAALGALMINLLWAQRPAQLHSLFPVQGSIIPS